MSGIIGVSPNMKSGVLGKFPAGHVIQTAFASSHRTMTLDSDHDMLVEVAFTLKEATSYVMCRVAGMIRTHTAGQGAEIHLYRGDAAGTTGNDLSGSSTDVDLMDDPYAGLVATNSGSVNFIYTGSGATGERYRPFSGIVYDVSPSTSLQYYKLGASAYSTTQAFCAHDGQQTLEVMEIAQ